MIGLYFLLYRVTHGSPQKSVTIGLWKKCIKSY